MFPQRSMASSTSTYLRKQPHQWRRGTDETVREFRRIADRPFGISGASVIADRRFIRQILGTRDTSSPRSCSPDRRDPSCWLLYRKRITSGSLPDLLKRAPACVRCGCFGAHVEQQQREAGDGDAAVGLVPGQIGEEVALLGVAVPFGQGQVVEQRGLLAGEVANDRERLWQDAVRFGVRSDGSWARSLVLRCLGAGFTGAGRLWRSA